VNTILCQNVHSAVNSVQTFVDQVFIASWNKFNSALNIKTALLIKYCFENKDFKNLNECLEKMSETSMVSPKCKIISDQINECIAFDCSTRESSNQILNEVKKKDKQLKNIFKSIIILPS
jgi:hypothetical protein